MDHAQQSGEFANLQEPKVPVFSLEDEVRLEAIRTLRRGEPMGWGATPLNAYRADVRAQQLEVEAAKDALFYEDLPEWMPPELAESIHFTYMSRREHRRIRNFESFKLRGVRDLRTGPDELIEMADRTFTGHAHPAEIHLVGAYYEFAARELGCVSVPFGKFIHDEVDGLPALRNAINECVVIHNGELLELVPVYEVIGYEETDFIDSDGTKKSIPHLKMTRTYKYAQMGKNCSIYERSSFDVRLDKIKEYNPAVAERSQGLRKPRTIVPADHVLATTLTQVLADDRFDIASPVSVTAWEVDEALRARYLDNKDYRKAINLKDRFGADEVDGSYLRVLVDEVLDAQKAAKYSSDN